MKFLFLTALAALTFSFLPATAAVAQDLLPPVAAAPNAPNDLSQPADTDPIIRLTPDKSELIPLPRDAVSVVVGNPNHLSVLLDTPRMLVLVPKAPGATSFTVLDEAGTVVMQRHALVAAPKDKYVRIRRSCPAGSTTCRATSVYFCPDMCHEVDVTQMGEETPPPTMSGSTDSSSSGSSE